MTVTRKAAVWAALIVVVAAVAGGGCWLHWQRREQALAMLSGVLTQSAGTSLSYGETSYSLFSRTLIVRDLRVYADPNGTNSPRATQENPGSDGSGATPLASSGGKSEVARKQPVLQAGMLRLKGVDCIQQGKEAGWLASFEELEMRDLAVALPSGGLKVESLSTGPAKSRILNPERLAALPLEQKNAEREAVLRDFSMQSLRLVGVSADYAAASGKQQSFTFSAAELTLGRITLEESGPLRIKDMQWRSGVSADGQTNLASGGAKILAFERLRLPDLKWLEADSLSLSDPAAYEMTRNVLKQDLGLSGLRIQGIVLQYSLFGVRVEELGLSIEQKNGATEIVTAVDGLDFGRMSNMLLLRLYPELAAIPNAADVPLSYFSNGTLSLRWFAPDNGCTLTSRFGLRDIAEMEVTMEMDTMTLDEALEKSQQASLSGVDPFQAGRESGRDMLRGVRFMDLSITDYKLSEYAYQVLAAKTGLPPDEVRAQTNADVMKALFRKETRMNLEAIEKFLTHSGTLQIHMAARNGTVPIKQLDLNESVESLFSTTVKHLPRPSKTP